MPSRSEYAGAAGGTNPLPAFTALAEDDARTLTTFSLLWRIRCSLLGLNNCSVCLDVRQELQVCRGVALLHSSLERLETYATEKLCCQSYAPSIRMVASSCAL